MKKLIISFIFFFSFFNGVFNNGYSDTKLYDTDEATIEIDSARIDKDNLQISWLVNGIENIDEVILSVRELTPDGLLGCLLYTSPSPRDCRLSRMPSSA